MERNFNSLISTMKGTIATWDYYTDFNKVYENVNKVKVELNILNSLIGSMNIEQDFINLVNEYPKIIRAIPLLLAKRESEIAVLDANGKYHFSFINMNYSIKQYSLFMKNSGLFNLLQNHIINNLIDYALGVEVGMDSNGRKNRTGHIMEDLVESYLQKAGLIKGKTYFKEVRTSEMNKLFGIDLSNIINKKKAEKRFDFVFLGSLGTTFACECNFYIGGGSKLNETARSYKNIALETKDIKNFQFIWVTDGKGWLSARSALEETFDVLKHIYNLEDLSKGVISDLVDNPNYLKSIL